ncbi:unnamed protein product [Allacma fusca]|uniref:Uncharacterized protein n=1 Tax=Allacma fusca TaxID=39272 RepID=A0A8J2JSV6_9HEXA|nr:unnamed protein product [Allacma fusca]
MLIDGNTEMDYQNIPDTVKEVSVRPDADEDDNRCTVVAKPLIKVYLSEEEFKEKYPDFQLNDEKIRRGASTVCAFNKKPLRHLPIRELYERKL